jgi:hypothetical protein
MRNENTAQQALIRFGYADATKPSSMYISPDAVDRIDSDCLGKDSETPACCSETRNQDLQHRHQLPS